MLIEGQNYKIVDQYDKIVTIPDCFVLNPNKLGDGHGESKLYIGSKKDMYAFYGNEGFDVKCFLLKKDLQDYLLALKNEYWEPSQNYHGRDNFKKLWQERYKKVEALDDVIFFSVQDQDQIEGSRGYVNSQALGYQLIRELSLPLVTYISSMELENTSGIKLFYWKLFADFDAIEQKKCISLVFSYGKKNNIKDNSTKEQQVKEFESCQRRVYAREGQDKYRALLLEECPYCPFTMINDERLLIASHIKPWAASNDKEKIDPKNGFMFSPLFDRLFDRGFITFTDDKVMHVSNWLTPKNRERMSLNDKTFIQHLPLTKERCNYLEFHRSSVFHGIIE